MRRYLLRKGLSGLKNVGARLARAGKGMTRGTGPRGPRLQKLVKQHKAELKSSRQIMDAWRKKGGIGRNSLLNMLIVSPTSLGAKLMPLMKLTVWVVVSEALVTLLHELWEQIEDIIDDLEDLPSGVKTDLRRLAAGEVNPTTISEESVHWSIMIAMTLGLDAIAQALTLVASPVGAEDRNEEALLKIKAKSTADDLFESDVRDSDISLDYEVDFDMNELASLLRIPEAHAARVMAIVRRDVYEIAELYDT